MTNAWLLYRKQMEQLYLPNARLMSLLEFHSQKASGLTQAGKLSVQLTTKRGQSSASSVQIKKRRKSLAEAIPQNNLRHDRCGPFPHFNAKQHRCQHCSKGHMHMHFLRCKVFLCINRDRNSYNKLNLYCIIFNHSMIFILETFSVNINNIMKHYTLKASAISVHVINNLII